MPIPLIEWAEVMKMRAFLEIVLSLLAVTGLLALGWLCFGMLLRPMGGKGAVTLLPARGEGEDLEQALTGLLWLRGAGLTVGRIVVADLGLTGEGRDLARLLTEQETGVYLCSREELPQCLETLLEAETNGS